jgi:glyoxylase-like metal-dependent hydrolase (beta-lactamase superfamily II)
VAGRILTLCRAARGEPNFVEVGAAGLHNRHNFVVTNLSKRMTLNAFWPASGYATFFITDDFAMLRNSVGGPMPSKYKTIELDGDLDLFGDNSIYIHRTVSHTPGSQIMVVRLPKTGTVVLTSDAVYLQENLDKNILPSIGSVYDPVGMLDAYAWVKRVHDAEGGDIIFAHDPDVYKAHKHSPEYYE